MQHVYIRENGTKLAWLAKQPNCRGIGRQEASALVYRASAIANGEAIENLKAVLAYWRKNHTMDLNRQTASSQSLVTFTSTSQNINTALSGFRKAFFNLATIKATGILQDILYRHHLTYLYDCYRNAEALLDRMLSTIRPRGVSDASFVKKQLFNALYPSTNIPSSSLIDSSTPSAKQWRYFIKCLAKGYRWHYIRETLGSGILALIPISKLPNSFIERLSSAIFKAFLGLIARFYPDAIKFGQLIEHFMQNALIGRQPPYTHLPIKHLSDDQLQDMHLSDLV